MNNNDETDCPRCNGTGKLRCPHIPSDFDQRNGSWHCKCGAFRVSDRLVREVGWNAILGKENDLK